MTDEPSNMITGRGNLPELSVAELSVAIKRTLEGAFERVRVRGEISGFKRAASGHLYMTLKDADAVLDAVCWRGTAQRLSVGPEDGLEVIATGRVTTYPGRSKYQLVIEALELAGEGALLKLLEERKRKLAAEGLFEPSRKRALPYLPSVIGVVTSPTGAVIRDILHRLAERFPRRVLVWPVLVQGDGAAEQIAAAIEGFNRLTPGAAVPRPDVVIVARGGGSLEDLWAFNEEIVVRAAAASQIPLISAVGHETDTTLIDFASDRRAPTPTAAAEIAVPVRGELVELVLELGHRVLGAINRWLIERGNLVEGLARGLPEPRRLLEEKSQALDDRVERLQLAVSGLLRHRGGEVRELAARLTHPRQQIRHATQTLQGQSERLALAGDGLLRRRRDQLAGLKPRAPRGELRHAEVSLKALTERLDPALQRFLRLRSDELLSQARILDGVSYQQTLARGFAVVHGPDGLVTRAGNLPPATEIELEFADGRRPAVTIPGKGQAGQGRSRARQSPETQGTLL